MTARLEFSDVTIRTAGGRALFEGLNLSLTREHVALVGRNGVGKSSLLDVMAGEAEAAAGRVTIRSKPYYVPQALEASAASVALRTCSHGEQQQRALGAARASNPEILLLDEPSDHLDEASVADLRGWLAEYAGCLVVATHDRQLLQDFRHFFMISESGCRYFCGTLSELDAELEREHHETEQRYAKNLNRLAAHEANSDRVARRKARKRRAGRCAELDRATSRMRLNQKRSAAQLSHGRLSKLREERLGERRAWSEASRRALRVKLSLELPVPELPEQPKEDLLILNGVCARVAERTLFESLDLQFGRRRVALVGANGSGKTTLLEIALGRRVPSAGSALRDATKIGVVEQGGANWMRTESLLELLSVEGTPRSHDELAKWLVAHKFPLSLAERPVRSLSAGERARAALICLFRRVPAVELLVLDEPTFSLDLVGQRAMGDALRAWPGGLLVASHDRAFLEQIGVDTWLRLGA